MPIRQRPTPETLEVIARARSAGLRFETVLSEDDWVQVPERVALSEARLIFPPPGSLWRDFRIKRRRPLEEFIGLADAEPESFQRYSEEYGRLMLCQLHARPHGRWTVTPAAGACDAGLEEPLDVWRRYARSARAMVSLGADLHRGHLGQVSDWREVFPGHRRAPWWRRSVDTDRRVLMEVVTTDWLAEGGVRPEFRWGHGHPLHFRLVASGLFGRLALDLAFSLALSGGLEVCAGCGKPFGRPPGGRRAATGRRAWCPECKADGRDRKAAARDARARRGASSEAG